ncbi:hypothetical protein FRB99_007015, partial [Tulasnella sp. 403]
MAPSSRSKTSSLTGKVPPGPSPRRRRSGSRTTSRASSHDEMDTTDNPDTTVTPAPPVARALTTSPSHPITAGEPTSTTHQRIEEDVFTAPSSVPISAAVANAADQLKGTSGADATHHRPMTPPGGSKPLNPLFTSGRKSTPHSRKQPTRLQQPPTPQQLSSTPQPCPKRRESVLWKRTSSSELQSKTPTPGPKDLRKRSGEPLLSSPRRKTTSSKSSMTCQQNARKSVPKESSAHDYMETHEDFGNIRFIPNESFLGHLSAPPRKRLVPLLTLEEGQELMVDIYKKDMPWVYATVYHHPHPDDDDAAHLQKGLEAIEKASLAGINAAEYEVRAIKKAAKVYCNTLLIVCKNNEAEARLLKIPGFAFKLGSTSRTFFLQGRESWGNVIVIDVYNAHDNFDDFLRYFISRFHLSMKWDTYTDSQRWPTHLAIAPLPDTVSSSPWTITPEARPGNWRVAFAPKPEAALTFQIPEIAGITIKGMITMSLPEFCQTCGSHAHSNNQCPWWEVPGVALRPKRPATFQQLNWVIVRAIHPISGKLMERTAREVRPVPKSREGTPALPKPQFAKGRGWPKGKGKAS